MSALGPSYSRPWNTSGAAYGGDPHHVRSVEFGVNVLLNPKSANWKYFHILITVDCEQASSESSVAHLNVHFIIKK